ncbi:DEAD/DEAH box helicase family protein [Spirochaeta cellobiosiphila]|uniref:DEAD/DEAH box helicase family protein n=1 Tax=Spirochaeta cellobiosiphila TaxID=504483 RepID=UPI0003F79C57|nr:DEAD/DEAH box helicase family protein [Spirochaeta cellobiosiphila]
MVGYKELFPITFRKYQEDMIETFEKQLSLGDKIFHYVAPPGSGKTLIGLELFRRLGLKAVVFSPNLAIQAQWINKLNELSEFLVASDIGEDCDLLSLTYQSISVKNSKGELHPNSIELIKSLDNRKVIILDECHHLTAHWAKVIEDLLKKDVFLIGLTATPPFDKGLKDIDQYSRLLEEVDYEILLPPVVKEGYLAPYQDLVYVVEPTDHEVELLRRLSKELDDLLCVLRNLEDLTPIQLYISDYLEDPFVKDKSFTFSELYKYDPLLTSGLVKFLMESHCELPFSVIPNTEYESPLTLEELIKVLELYCLRYLYPKKEGKIHYKKVKDILKNIGYSLTRNGIRPIDGGLKDLLSFSKSKTIGAREVIRQELRCQGDSLRALILTDLEVNSKSLGDKDYREGTSAVDVMKQLVTDPETDEADPIMVTGKSLWIDDDLYERIKEWALDYVNQKNLNILLEAVSYDGFVEIVGSGSDWNSKNYVVFVSKLLEDGVTKCLISTKNLLGEGWDSISLNTLVDLTVVSSFAYVNQIRGRTIRLNEKSPLKTANNWDILTVHEDNLQGGYDLMRLRKKFSQFYGLSEDGVVEKGLGHVHPLLGAGSVSSVVKQRDTINKVMLNRANDRLGAYKRWKVGGSYQDKQTYDFEIIFDEKMYSRRKVYRLVKRTANAILRGMKYVYQYANYGKFKIEWRDTNILRVYLVAPSSADLFAQSLQDFFSPLYEQRYFMIIEDHESALGQKTVFPVPTYFGVNKDRANYFMRKWRMFSWKSVYTVSAWSEEGRAIINKFHSKKSMLMTAYNKEIWL